VEIATRIDRGKYDAFRWRHELSMSKKLALALGIAGLTGLLAQTRVILPWTPVPVSGQTLAVLLAGVFLGRWWGGISMAIYAGLGVMGLPWFAGFSHGLTYLAGPTGGYIFGFILAGFLLGHLTDTYIRSRSFLSMLVLMLFANFVLIHGMGLLQLGLWLSSVRGEAVTLSSLLWMGIIPFIIGDVIKIVMAAAIARGITPKSAYNGELDRDKWANWRIP
jgi:biotin transport system substrate-specific component